MIKKIKIEKTILDLVKIDILKFSKILTGKNFKNIEYLLQFLNKNNKFRPSLFDLLNMMPTLGYINYILEKKISKILKRNLVNWTYPQIRIDCESGKNFNAPLHSDKWIINKKKEGFILWFPINERGASMYFAMKKNIKKINYHKYWGLESKANVDLKTMHLNYGEAILFDKNVFHKSYETTPPRLTVQLRFEEFKKNQKNYKRSVTQKSDEKVLDFWRKKYA